MSKGLTEEEIAAAIQGYWHWYGIATFMRCPLKLDMSDTDIGLIGFPYSGGNGIERMQYLGPRAVRDRAVAYRRSHECFRSIRSRYYGSAISATYRCRTFSIPI